MVENVEVVAINSNNVLDRLRLCWGHLKGWKRLQIVRKSKEWLEKTGKSFAPTTLIAYASGTPVGIIEFIPQRLMKTVGLCPCRANPEKKMKSRYILGEEFDDYLFISCLWVHKDYQGKGVGRTLLHHFLNSEVFKNSSGALVYVTRRNLRWEEHIHWPAGPKEFYLKAGFTVEKTLDKPVGYLLSCRNPTA
jgi:ribosomal protein S18 acetylase RimI-like enzyme